MLKSAYEVHHKSCFKGVWRNTVTREESEDEESICYIGDGLRFEEFLFVHETVELHEDFIVEVEVLDALVLVYDKLFKKVLHRSIQLNQTRPIPLILRQYNHHLAYIMQCFVYIQYAFSSILI